MLNYEGGGTLAVPDTGRRVTIYRGQKTWNAGMPIEASSLRQSGGSRGDRENWTAGLVIQFRRNVAGAASQDQASKQRLEGLLLNAQQFAFQNPFVPCSFSYFVARSFANAGDTSGFVLTIEGPWYSGVDFEFLRRLFGLYGGPFDYLQEFGIPEKISSPFDVVRVERLDDPRSAPARLFP